VSSVLVADPDTRLVAAVTRALAHFGLESVGCTSREKLEQTLNARRFDAMVADADLVAGLEPRVALEMLVVLTRSYLSGRGGVPADRVVVLDKPFTMVDLAHALRDELGDLLGRPVSIVDALRHAHELGKTMRLDVESGGVYFAAGEIVGAVRGACSGERALLEILARRAPPCGERSVPAEGAHIERPFRELMLDLLETLDADERRPDPSGVFRVERLE
jgi:hypothetical protein